MNAWTLTSRSLRHHWRAHVGVVLGAAVGTAVLVGALVIGDSVRESLRRTALARIGGTQLALAAPRRLFRAALADDFASTLGAPVAPVLRARAIAAREDGTARVNQARLLGVDRRFWALGGGAAVLGDGAEAAAVNTALARRLGVRPGDSLLVRVEKPSALPRDAPLAETDDVSLALRVEVRAVASDADFGRFGLEATQVAPLNVFVPLEWLQEQLGTPGRANLLLVGSDADGGPTAATAEAALRRVWQPADAELEVRAVGAPRAGAPGPGSPAPGRSPASAALPGLAHGADGWVEVRTRQVFLDPVFGESAAAVAPDAVGILTYLVNELRVGDRAAPYSMATAVGALGAEGRLPPAWRAAVPEDLADDEVVVSAWLAEDLGARPGDSLEMTYYVLGPMRRIETRTSRFRVRAVAAPEGPAADPTLMPDFPGLADAENCRDWTPGVPIDLKKIRDKDEAYWKQYRGTPKALVTLAAGRRMWSNRFGDLTAVRYPSPPASVEGVREGLRRRLDPASAGLALEAVRERALRASGQAIDFGQLFLGLSLFLVAAALVLVGLLFAFGVQERAEEVGTLLAVGFPPSRVRGLLLAEGSALALAGTVLGTAGGLAYTRLVLYLLTTVWRGAVASADLEFHASAAALAVGAVAGLLVAVGAIALTVRRQGRAPARELLSAGAEAELRIALPRAARGWMGVAVAGAGAAGAGAVLSLGGETAGEGAAGAFFGAGALLLVAAMGVSQAMLARVGRAASEARLSVRGLAWRGAARRRGRSLATIALLACGAFLVVAVGANRKDPLRGADRRDSGTGGFALYGESALPVHVDLAAKEGREAFALPADVQRHLGVVPMRVAEGDDASCLNLNRAQKPRMVGVRPEALAERGAFAFTQAPGLAAGESPWSLLARREADGAVPAVADQATLTWALGREVGDTIAMADERGRPFDVRLVGALAGSILQGSLIIAERDFLEKFPSTSGYRAFLMDAGADEAETAAKTLSERLADVGLALVPAAERLGDLHNVENTYLAIFQALGGLGLALGTIGLGVVVLRNVLERRGELALMRAVGFERGALVRLVLYEHWALAAMGLVSGVGAALVAVAPTIRSAGAPLPWASLGLTLAAVAASAVAGTYAAAKAALAGPLLAALRNE